jgi:Uma2 family endonuclease
MPVLKRDSQYHNYADYLIWSRECGDELIDGVAYVREPPSPYGVHQEMLFELAFQIRCALEDKRARVYIAPFDVRLPKAGEPDDQVETVVQPDVLIVEDSAKIDHRGLRGAPDWVAEILSPSTARHDRIRKLSAYERAGVREYWLIHPSKRDLTTYQLEDDGRYGAASVIELQGRTTLKAVPDVTIDWDRLLARLERHASA